MHINGRRTGYKICKITSTEFKWKEIYSCQTGYKTQLKSGDMILADIANGHKEMNEK